MKIYLSGPMTGIPDLNRQAFLVAEGRLTLAGHTVTNPARIPLRDDWEYADYLRAAMLLMLDTEAVALLPGWRKSRGARAEYQVAHALGMPCRTVAKWVAA